jgi:GNAT superfamily N-acetyltransferase
MPTPRSRSVQSSVLPPASIAVTFTVDSIPVDRDSQRLGWSVFHDDQLVLHAGGLLSRSTALDLDVVAIEWHTSIASVCQTACESLLKHVIAQAAEQGVTSIRCLACNDTLSFPTRGLEASGFKAVATLQEWITSAKLATTLEPTLVFQRFPFDTSLSIEQTKLLTGLLQNCLENSQDLQSLATPDATVVLTTWQSLHRSEAVLLSVNGDEAGLAVVSREVDSQQATLEYIGVSSTFRRRGFGRLLLHQAQSVVASGAPAATTPFTAWCDRENHPAMQLYRNSGFTPGQPGQIWLRAVTSSLSST